MALIFDNVLLTRLVMSWQQDNNPDTLATIVDGSRALIEAIVSSYDPYFRDDLIQESFLKLVIAVNAYNPELATLHTFFTTVIRNACISWLSKYDRTYIDIDDISDMLGSQDASIVDLNCAIEDLKAYNRERFRSLNADEVDTITELMVRHLQENIPRNKSITRIANIVGLDKDIIAYVVAASVVYLRLYYGYGQPVVSERYAEFSLLPELKLLVGDELYNRITVLFSGFVIKLP